MTFEFAAAPVAVRPDIGELFAREWRRLAGAGSWWSGSERVALAAAARGAAAHGDLPPAAAEAAGRVYAAPAQIRRRWVEGIAAEVGYPAYVEIVGVVARLSAVDGFHRGLGLTEPDLPDPDPGTPDHHQDERARSGAAWVPMVGGSSIVGALSLLPAEAAAQEDMHGPLYLDYEGMADVEYVGGLTRAQMELVAARTSAVNECFY